ncbi:MAG: ATP-binding domain-containing protein, partial [Candidatus Micrarchaeaceae archaeon]
VNLNAELQKHLNHSTTVLIRGEITLKLGDKVLQRKNNRLKETYNGDIGIVQAIDEENQEITVDFDGRLVTYDFKDIDEIKHLGYAITNHKSQGSEYPVIIMPVVTSHYIMLQRNLIYTGVTRGKSMVILVGTKKALGIAIRNNKTENRYTMLETRLRNTILANQQKTTPVLFFGLIRPNVSDYSDPFVLT